MSKLRITAILATLCAFLISACSEKNGTQPTQPLNPASLNPASLNPASLNPAPLNPAPLNTATIPSQARGLSIDYAMPELDSNRNRTLDIYGAGFVPETRVQVGSLPCYPVQFISSSHLRCNISNYPSEGAMNVVLTNPDLRRTVLPNGYVHRFENPTVSSVNPPDGETAGGYPVDISGIFPTYSRASIRAYIGSEECIVQTITSVKITCTAPRNVPGFYNVTVTYSNGRSGSLPSGFRYIQPRSNSRPNPLQPQAALPLPSDSSNNVLRSPHSPTIATIYPTEGPTGGGTELDIVGENFSLDAVVTVGGTRCTNIQLVHSGYLTCRTGPGRQGLADIVVTQPNHSPAHLRATFSYVDPLGSSDDMERMRTNIRLQGIRNLLPTQTKYYDGSVLEVAVQNEGRLSPFWNQEYTGSDLAEDFLAEQSSNRIVSVGMIDIGGEPFYFPSTRLSPDFLANYNGNSATRGDHGTLCGNLIIGHSPMGTGPQAQLTSLLLGNSDGRQYTQPNILAQAMHRVLSTDPFVINISMAIDRSPTTLGILRQLAQRALLVVSAGNDYPLPVSPHFETLRSVIVVGSIDASGVRADYSQEGSTVTIMAPAGRSNVASMSAASTPSAIASTRGLFFLGGTSAAAPQVTGALSNVLSLFPSEFRMSGVEAQILLKRTSIPTFNSLQSPQVNGAGTLNAFRLIRVAARLKERGWVHLSESERLRALQDPLLYDFRSEAEALVDSARALLILESSTIDDQRELIKIGFKSVRKSFLLHPSEETRFLLEEFYRVLGLVTNAQFYRSMAGHLNPVVPALDEGTPATPALPRQGSYSGSEAEAFKIGFLARSQLPVDGALSEVYLNRQRVGVSGQDVPRPFTDEYRITDSGLAARIRAALAALMPQNRASSSPVVGSRQMPLTLTREQLDDLPADLRDQIIVNIGEAGIEYIPGSENPVYQFRPIDPDAQANVDQMIATIDQRINDLNRNTLDGYYQIRGSFYQNIALYNEALDRFHFEKMLDAIEQDDRASFIEHVVFLSTRFDRNFGGAKRGFIDTMSYLFVKKQFPSEGLRQKYFHFVFVCGHIY